MVKASADQERESANPVRYIVQSIDQKTQKIIIPKEGFSFKGLFTLFVILFWLMMILVWTLLLVNYGFIWTLLSIPFWLLGGITLRLALKMIFASQEITVDEHELMIVKKQGGISASVNFIRKEISDVCLVEGSYKTLSGITRKGVYPAIISNEQAFGFGERCSNDEKQKLIEIIKIALKFK